MITRFSLYNGEIDVDFEEDESGKHEYRIGDVKKTGVTTFLKLYNKPALVPWAAAMATEQFLEMAKPGMKLDEVNIPAMAEAIKGAPYKRSKGAADLGTLAHAWINDHINGKNPKMPTNPQLLNSINGFLAWEKEMHPEYLAAERVVYSRRYDFCGKFDWIMRIQGKVVLTDFKSSNQGKPQRREVSYEDGSVQKEMIATGIYPEYLLQDGGYLLCHDEEREVDSSLPEIDDVAVIRSGKTDGTFEYRDMRSIIDLYGMKIGGLDDLKQTFVETINLYRKLNFK